MLGVANPMGSDLPDPDLYAAGSSPAFDPAIALATSPVAAVPPGAGVSAIASRPGMFAGRSPASAPINQQIAAVPVGAGARALANLPQGMFANPAPAEKKPGFFGQGGTGRTIIGYLGDGILQSLGQRPVYGPAVQHQRQMAAERARQQTQFAHDDALHLWERGNQIDDRNFKADQPQYFTAGNDRVAYDPTTGQSSVLYHGSQPFEDYAVALGLKPGTPEYTEALQDYVLRGNGPTAYGYDLDLEGARQRDRLALRSTPTYAQAHPHAPAGNAGGGARPPSLAGTVAPILAKVARGETLTPGEQTALDTYYHRGGKGGRGGRGGITRVATNPQTGEKRGWNGTAWVPIQ